MNDSFSKNSCSVHTMTPLRCLSVGCALIVIVGGISLLAEGFSGTASQQALPGHSTPEAAATALIQACVTRSPKLFTRTRLLGVCDGPISTRKKYADCLDLTTFSNGTNDFNVSELSKRLRVQTLRAVAGQVFDTNAVNALHFQFVSTYYAEKFMSVDVAVEDLDGVDYRGRIVVGMLGDRWHALPRCRSSKSFYQIADAMRLTAADSAAAK
jgi:hypothetical protein